MKNNNLPINRIILPGIVSLVLKWQVPFKEQIAICNKIVPACALDGQACINMWES